jgi:hypothetical protein
MTCYSTAPRNDPDQRIGIWDELRRGVDHKLGWLGRPEGPAVHLAAQSPDLLEGRGIGNRLADWIAGNVNATATPRGLKIWPSDPNTATVNFAMADVPTDGPNLFVAVKMLAEPMAGYPKNVARLAKLGVSGGITDLMASPPLAVGMRLRGESEEVDLDPESGASCQLSKSEIDGDRRPAYLVHPPYRFKKGYTFWTQQAWVPGGSELRFALGMGELSPERSDGVRFEVHVAVVDGDQIGTYEKVFETTTKEHRWQPQSVSLSRLADRQVRFKFVADCGPDDDATTDHARWGEVRIVQAGLGDQQITPAKQIMTWVNDRTFSSNFYFHHIKSPQVSLSFQVEGPEPIVLQSLTVHARPDVMYRVFEGGIVLANPSRQPSTFDLESLTPGRRYRRIQATAHQDLKTNNGQTVGNTVTLGERDALFLIRER